MNLPRNLYLLVRDDQDSIRVCGNSSCIALGSVFSQQDRIELILPLFLELACDHSWRVRYSTAIHIGEICNLFSQEIITEKILPEYVKLLNDSELEVRTGAVQSLSAISKHLDTGVIVKHLLSIVTALSKDPSENVRIGLATEVLSMV